MKTTPRLLNIVTRISAIIALLGFSAHSLDAAGTSTWTGGGIDSRWTTSANWVNPPSGGETLLFTGTTRLSNTNSFTLGTSFGSITFNSPAGAFSLFGNAMSLSGGITNNQPVTLQTITVPIALSVTPTIDIVDNASLTMSGVISGASGLTKVHNGTLTLVGANTYTGVTAINGGSVNIGNDNNLGTAPAAVTVGKLVLNAGSLDVTQNMTLSANRGVSVGPSSGTGWGRFDVESGVTLIYRGVIANNGTSTSALVKGSPGNLTISGTNTYTGATSNRVGLLLLDFAQTTSPTTNIIPSSSLLSIGGENSGVGVVNPIQLTMTTATSGTNSQTFNNTYFDLGHSVIQVTNATGGTAVMNLGKLNHTTNGGAVTFILPTLRGAGGAGAITTTSTNVNGILGGWATLGSATVQNGIIQPTNWASVDANGNIVPFTNFFVYASGNLAGQVGPTNNVLIAFPLGLNSVRVDNENAASTTTINSLLIGGVGPFALNIGSNNVLRLGKFGGILITNTGGVGTWELGNGVITNSNGTYDFTQFPVQNVGTLTAGGADNTPGELIFDIDSNSQTGGNSLNVETAIADNGINGPVTVIKTGAGPMKFRGHNSFSGGMYILQGRIQMAGSELPSGLSGPGTTNTANPDAFGTGPVFVLPGAEAFPSGAGGNTNINLIAITNNWFVAGNGVSDLVGVFRMNGIFSNGVITLIGNSRFGGGATNAPVPMYDKITGPFNLDFGASGNAGGSSLGVILYNQSNDWSGNTTIVGRTGNAAGHSRLVLGTNDVIPDGFGKGNVILGLNGTGIAGQNQNISTIDMNGFNETINGLISGGNAAATNSFIYNSSNSTISTLTLGNNDAAGLYDGTLRDAPPWAGPNGVLALTKIGAGVQTMRGTNLYSGTTIVNAGTLAISGGGSISNSANVIVNTSAALDISGMTNGGFATPNIVQIRGGTLIGNTTNGSGIGTLTMTNGFLTPTLDGKGINLIVGTLTTGGDSNVVNIVSLPVVSSYPTQFTLIKYTSFNSNSAFVFGARPSLSTLGFISNDVPSTRIIMVLTNGPKALTWDGCTNSLWDINTTLNWLGFGVPQPFNSADTITFDDTACSSLVNVTTTLFPASTTISNASLTYTFFGSGSIGSGGLLKLGSGTATFVNTGFDSYGGGVVISNGLLIFGSDNLIAGGVTINSNSTVQIGTNGGTGTLPGGSIINNGTLIFNRGADLAVGNVISGVTNDLLIKTNAGVLALNAANTFTGAVSVVGGTLRTGNNSALGRTNTGTTISAGATLDVNGANLGGEGIFVTGTGVGGAGAIVNSGADQINALRLVTLTGDSTFGGTARWDIRESGTAQGDAAVSGTFNITKVGTNQVSLVGAQAPGINNIIVQQGMFGIERNTAFAASGTITVSNGATIEFFSNNNSVIHQVTDLYGDGVTASILENNGRVTLDGTSTLHGNVIFTGNGVDLTMSGSVGGTANLIKIGSSQLSFSGNVTYNGSTTISNGTVVFDGNKNSGTGITVWTNATLGGGGFANSINENVTLNGGGLSPGNVDNFQQELFQLNGNLTMNSSSNVFGLNADVNNGNDKLAVSGNLTLTGSNIFRITVVDHLNAGDTYTLVTYGGTPSNVDTNHIGIVPPPFGYAFQLIDPTTTSGSIQIQVTLAIGFDFWVGNDPTHPTFWDVGVTTNWDRNGANSFKSNDFACFSDQDGRTPNANSTNISLIGKVTVAGTIFTNGSYSYELSGSGSLSGGELILEGGTGPGNLINTVTIANSGSNDWTGGILIDANALMFGPAQLYVGDGSTNGNLGFGTITNDGVLVFNHGGGYTNLLIVSNNIVNGPNSGLFGAVYGITNIGSGVVLMGGSSTFTNELDVVNGVLAAGNDASGTGSAFGSTNPVALVIATNGIGTIDINGHSLGAKQLLVGGGGLNGQGALINNGVQQINGFQSVTLAGDTTFGGGSQFVGGTNTYLTEPGLSGTNRWDIRGGLATLATYPPGSAFSITKVGGNQVSLVGITNIDPAIKNIDIQGGSFAVQTTTTQLGDPNGTITIHSNAALNVFALTAGPVNKKILIHGGGTYWPASGTTTNVGTVTLGTNAADLCTFNLDANLKIQTNPIVGPGSLVTSNTGTLTLASSNGWTGSTILRNGTLALIGTALDHSPLIDLASVTNTVNPVIDVTGRNDFTLTINSGQTLQGRGIIRGSLTVNSGGIIAPGHSIGVISVTTNVTLGGSTTIELDAVAVTSDQINCTNQITYGGTLTVTNINGTLAAGQSYRLFRAGTYGVPTFSSITLPTLTPPLYWTNNLATTGTIAVVSPVVPHPVITSITLTSPNIVINATNGAPSGPFYVLSTTNVSLPLSNWTAIATNSFDGSGNVVNYTVTNAIVGPQRYFLLQLP